MVNPRGVGCYHNRGGVFAGAAVSLMAGNPTSAAMRPRGTWGTRFCGVNCYNRSLGRER